MKIATLVAGILLGLLFIASSVVVLFNIAPQPTLPEGTPAAHFMAAFNPTGYMLLVKICELVGGVLVAIPKTRNFGLLILGPIIVNIIATTVLVMKGSIPELVPGAIVGFLALFLLIAERRKFAGLLN